MNAHDLFRPRKDSPPVKLRIASLMVLALLAGCTRKGNLEEGGIYTVRSDCPQVAIPAATGDITTFDPAGSTASSAIDVSATITNLRDHCQDTTTDGTNVVDVMMRRLRAKVDDPFATKMLHTIRGVGYVLRVEEA